MSENESNSQAKKLKRKGHRSSIYLRNRRVSGFEEYYRIESDNEAIYHHNKSYDTITILDDDEDETEHSIEINPAASSSSTEEIITNEIGRLRKSIQDTTIFTEIAEKLEKNTLKSTSSKLSERTKKFNKDIQKFKEANKYTRLRTFSLEDTTPKDTSNIFEEVSSEFNRNTINLSNLSLSIDEDINKSNKLPHEIVTDQSSKMTESQANVVSGIIASLTQAVPTFTGEPAASAANDLHIFLKISNTIFNSLTEEEKKTFLSFLPKMKLRGTPYDLCSNQSFDTLETFQKIRVLN